MRAEEEKKRSKETKGKGKKKFKRPIFHDQGGL